VPDHLRLRYTPASDPAAKRMAWLWRGSRREGPPHQQRATFAALLEAIPVQGHTLAQSPDLRWRQLGSPCAAQEGATHGLADAACLTWKYLAQYRPDNREWTIEYATPEVVSKMGVILLANPQVPKLVCPTCLLGRRKSLGNFPEKKYS
jgi:hypothetical protein